MKLLTVLTAFILLSAYAYTGTGPVTNVDVQAHDWEYQIDKLIYHSYHRIQRKLRYCLKKFKYTKEQYFDILFRLNKPSIFIRGFSKLIGRELATKLSLFIQLDRYGNLYRRQKSKLIYNRLRVEYRIKYDKQVTFIHKWYKYAIVVTLFILLALFVHPMFGMGLAGTVYYVSNAGDDSATGLVGHPWETVTKVNNVWNAGSFSPADIIGFNRGDTWSGTRLYANNGSTGDGSNDITITAYGSGDRPLIDGNATAENCIRINTNYVTISYLQCTDSTSNGVYMQQSYLTMDNCYLYSTGASNILHQGISETNITWTNTECYDAPGYGNFVFYGHTSGGSGNFLMEDCTAHSAKDNIQIHHSDGNGDLGNNIIVRDCESYDCITEEGIDLTAGHYVLLEDFYSHDNNWGAFIIGNHQTHTIIRRALGVNEGTSSSNKRGWFICSTYVEIYNSLIQVNSNCAHIITINDANPQDPDNISVHHCTLVATGSGGSSEAAVYLFDDPGYPTRSVDGFHFYNNIVVSGQARIVRYRNIDATGAGFDMDYNVYYVYGGSTGSYSDENDLYTFAEWQAYTGYDANSIEDNPDFVDITGATYAGTYSYLNYNLTDVSPAVGMASTAYTTYVNAWALPTDSPTPWDAAKSKIVTDYIGNARDGTTPDVGALEYDGEPPPPPDDNDTLTLESGDLFTTETGDTTDWEIVLPTGTTMAIGGDTSVKNIDNQSGSTLTGNASYTVTCTEKDANDDIVKLNGTHTDLNLKLTSDGKLSGTSVIVHNLEVD